ncbi:hypothetical protein [Aquimarina aquimarini]|uniref:hypothetical protein n=1 Tax=Aquimarina aquimarini TaxID=1191734 RepID=UPI000D55938F|nr:hypothetical protein [Aquimarina aquimarini]
MKKNFIYVLLISIAILSCTTDNIEESSNTLSPKEQQDKKAVSLIFKDNDPLSNSITNIDENTIEFSKNSGIDFSTLEYIVSGQISKAPEGFLRKITNVTYSNNKVIVATESVEINELTPHTEYQHIYNYDNYNQDFISKTANGDIIEYKLVADKAKKDISLGSFNISLNRVIFDADGNHSTTHDQIKAKGSVNIQPSLDLKLGIFFGSLEEFKSVVTFKNRADLDLTWSASHSIFSQSIPIANLNLPPTTIWAGWIPIVVTHTIKVTLDASGSVSARITGGIRGSMTVRKGMHYKNNNWDIIHDVDISKITFKPITATAGFNASLVLNSGFESAFYGSVGVGIQGGAGLYAEGSINANTNSAATIDWFGGIRANLGLYAKAGLFDIPGLTIRYDYPIYNYEYPLANGSIPLN